jgi:hypothetical protein
MAFLAIDASAGELDPLSELLGAMLARALHFRGRCVTRRRLSPLVRRVVMNESANMQFACSERTIVTGTTSGAQRGGVLRDDNRPRALSGEYVR